MTVLEASLRNLVREEAANAAVAVQAEFTQDLQKTIHGITAQAAGEAISRAIKAIESYNRHRRPILAPEPSAAKTVKISEHDNGLLTDCRIKALELAMTAAPDNIIPTAAAFAEFIIDGTVISDVAPCDAPQTEGGAA